LIHIGGQDYRSQLTMRTNFGKDEGVQSVGE